MSNWLRNRNSRDEKLTNVMTDIFIMEQAERLWEKFDDNGCMYLEISDDKRLYRRGDKMYLIDTNSKSALMYDINGEPMMDNDDDGYLYCDRCDGEIEDEEYHRSIFVNNYVEDKPLSELFG